MGKNRFGKHSTAMDVLEGINLNGKTYLITGANSGIGYETARALAVHGAHVVMACRNMTTANEAKNNILDEFRDAKVDILHLENAELKSVEECAAAFTAHGWPLHCLILNAGVYAPVHRVTDDGFEATFQINHLAHFYLTKLLTPLLVQSAPSRVVVVASDAHKQARFSPSDIKWEKLSPTHKNNLNAAFSAYGISKFCNVLFANELNKRLQSQNVTANSLHPGVVSTNITRSSSFLTCFFRCCFLPIIIDSPHGAATTVYVATSDEVKDGEKYYTWCKATNATSFARNAESAKKLWNLSDEMIQHYQASINSQNQASRKGSQRQQQKD